MSKKFYFKNKISKRQRKNQIIKRKKVSKNKAYPKLKKF